MKKIFTLMLTMLATFCASAQVQFIKDGKVLEDGATIEFEAEAIQLAPNYFMVLCEPNEPLLKYTGTGSADLHVTVTKTKPESDELTWCGITQSCTPIREEEEQRSCTLAAGETTALALHANFTSGNYTSYTAKVTARAGIGAASTIYIKFTYSDPTGIAAAPTAGNIRFTDNAINYAFDTVGTHVLNVYASSGRLVKSEKLGQNGTCQLSELGQGVYLYEVKTNGQRVATGKVILK